MKKYAIKLSLVIVIVCVLLMIWLGLQTIDGDGTVPSYRFLEGCKPVACRDAKTEGVDKCYTYSFEADFNDVRSKSDAELIPAGFSSNSGVSQNLSGDNFPYRIYDLKERFPRGQVWIYIYDNRQYIDIHYLNKSVPKSENYKMAEKDGWVMIEVIYYRGWRWPF